jgi:hypothetical protein
VVSSVLRLLRRVRDLGGEAGRVFAEEVVVFVEVPLLVDFFSEVFSRGFFTVFSAAVFLEGVTVEETFSSGVVLRVPFLEAPLVVLEEAFPFLTLVSTAFLEPLVLEGAFVFFSVVSFFSTTFLGAVLEAFLGAVLGADAFLVFLGGVVAVFAML